MIYILQRCGFILLINSYYYNILWIVRNEIQKLMTCPKHAAAGSAVYNLSSKITNKHDTTVI